MIRELSQPAEAVWRVAFESERCVVMASRVGRTIMEVWDFTPPTEVEGEGKEGGDQEMVDVDGDGEMGGGEASVRGTEGTATEGMGAGDLDDDDDGDGNEEQEEEEEEEGSSEGMAE